MTEQKKAPVPFRTSLHGLAYDQTTASVPPIPIPITSAALLRDDSPQPNEYVPQIRVEDELSQQGPAATITDSSSLLRRSSRTKTRRTPADPEAFRGITLDIPTGGLGEELSKGSMEFTNRGSMLIDGVKMNNKHGDINGTSVCDNRTLMSGSFNQKTKSDPSLRLRAAAKVLSMDEEMLSQKVRSYYEFGGEAQTDLDGRYPSTPRMKLRWQDALGGVDAKSTSSISRETSSSDLYSDISITERLSRVARHSDMSREDDELAGGLEDWKNIQNEDVDRYGFIMPKSPPLAAMVLDGRVKRSSPTREPLPLQRISTSLQRASETPRRKHTIRRSPSNFHGVRTSGLGVARQVSGRSMNRPASSQSSYQGIVAGNKSKLRAVSNKLPHNRDRRLRDEAGDIFTIAPALADIAEDGEARGRTAFAKAKESEREDKWRKMARVVRNTSTGSGMIFTFDTTSSKLIERTWKGIPDSWRAVAWHAFLSSSAKKRPSSLSDEQLAEDFHAHQNQSSPDDVQIDIDVPRTISSHIMFRRRYRGGQRLLFRVLRAMSLHFPDTGYVQGMAALAATLLSYYDEEKAFIMLVRLWELRGLDKLYTSGFGGLMDALDEFETTWLGGGELAGKLSALGISPTAYGTRWYLTLFNYSIPFPAQLRVWDVFMLLGDDDRSRVPSPGLSPSRAGPLGTTLDVLHATSAALILGMRDILLDSDFENAMKVLTSWIPIKDEDLLMRIAKTEWKMHRRKR